jgi:hypothetical protein
MGMRIRELLSIPLIRGAESIYDENAQRWRRRFAYAEIPGCAVESDSALGGLRALELTRAALILERLAEGADVPCPRPPLRSVDIRAQLHDMGLDLPGDLLDLSEEQAVGNTQVTASAVEARTLAQRDLDPAPSPA